MTSQEVTKGQSMNGVDYTKTLAKDREYYQDAVKKTREASEQRLANAEARHEHMQDKKTETFLTDKAELEKNYQENLDGLKEKTRASIEDKNRRYQDTLNKERDKFNQEVQTKSKDFDERLNDIKSSYKRSFASERDNHTTIQDGNKKRYARNVQDIQNNTESKLKNYQEKLHGAGADLKDRYNRERQQLVRAQEDKLKEVFKDEGLKRADLKDRISTDIKKSKQVHDSDLAHMKDYSRDRLETMRKEYDDRFQGMAGDYSKKNEELVEAQHREATKTNQLHQEKILDTERDFNRQMRQVELEKRRRDNGSGEYAEVANGQKGLNEKKILESQVKHLNDEIVNAQIDYQNRRSQDQDAFNETLKTEKTEASARQERKSNELNAEKLVTVAKEREKALEQVQNREYQNKLDRNAYEQQLMLERNNANTRIKKLKENFNTSMKSLEEKNQQSLEEVTKASNQDKSEFLKKMHERRNSEVFAMKREFARLMDGTVQDYEQRLANFQRENEQLKMSIDQKVQNLVDQSDKQLATQKQIYEDKKVADQMGHQLLLDQRENSLKTEMNQMNLNYRKKMDHMQVESDRKLKLLTNDYENKLKELMASKSRDLNHKDMTHQVELERIKSAFTEEKSRIISQYENQISAMKVAHSEQMDQLKEFKRLS
jgi:hypothetical protein